jgi:endonuclease VIII
MLLPFSFAIPEVITLGGVDKSLPAITQNLMPEGPEIKLAADKIAKDIVDRPLTEVSFAFDHLRSFESELTAARIVSVTPQGKALLTRFSNQLSIYSHNQLYGVWYSQRAYDYPATNRQLRLAIHTEKRSALLYSASDIAALDDDQIAAHPFLKKLGPDVLESATTVEMVLDRLQSKTFHRKGFPALLLNQHFLGGLRNYLRSEVLFVAGIHPTLRPVDCSIDQLQKLDVALLELPRQSYATKGITNSLAIVEQLKQSGQTRRQYRHWVFSRQDCLCHTEILKDTLGGRRIYFCPSCQAK